LTLPAPERLEQGLQARRLDLVALRRGYQSQESRVRAAVLNQFPKINLGLNYATDNSAVSTLGPAATVELPLFNHNQGNIALERATRQRLFDEYVDRFFQARSETSMLLQEINSLTRQIAAAQQALPSLGRLVDVYRIATEQGNADVLSYYNAWNDLSQKQIDILRLKQQLTDDRISLELAVGEVLPQSPTPATQPSRRTPTTRTQPAVNGMKS
jgi:outer membrane protein TolC